MIIFKRFHRFIYNVLLNKGYICLFLVVAAIIIFVSHLGEMLNNVNNEKVYYCSEKIDVVYTWVNGSDERFLNNLKKYLNEGNFNLNDYSNARFDDKYELKFSLRSLEKYAPWVNHVYIVTNGQIPYWLNLDYEKVSIITHEDIFSNLDYLPTFSSPAIETNIHRISGLSKRFIYFNDDIFLNDEVFPEDFYSDSKGYLMYLAWPLPSCVPNCPWVYVGDGQCDSSCFNIDCQFDGNDCDNSNSPNSHHDFNHNYEDYEDDIRIVKRQIMTNNFAIPSEAVTNSSKIVSSLQTNKSQNIQTHKILTLLKMANVSEFVQEHNQKFLLTDKMKRRNLTHKSLRKRNKNLFNKTKHYLNNTQKQSNKRNLDTYALSLQHTNRIYNLAYGFKARKVPAHAPILINKNIMNNLQRKFNKEIEGTQKNRLRSPNDFQFSFSYYYYLMNEKIFIDVSDIFDRFDTDKSGTWSDREIRTILTKIHELPLTYQIVDHFEKAIINCSKYVKDFDSVTVPSYERYLDSKLPVVSKKLILNCPAIMNILNENFRIKPKYRFEIIKNAQGQYVMFQMLTSNISDVVGHLDEIRKEPRKFVCLNDNMNPEKIEQNDLVKAVLLDFFVSLFPKPSKFELPSEYRNRFLYVNDLKEWQQHHTNLKLFLLICVIILITICLFNVCKRRLIRQIKSLIYYL